MVAVTTDVLQRWHHELCTGAGPTTPAWSASTPLLPLPVVPAPVWCRGRLPPPVCHSPRWELFISDLDEHDAECTGSWPWPCLLPEELHTVLSQLMKKRASQKIDMDDASKWGQGLCVLYIWEFLQTQSNFCSFFAVFQTTSGLARCSCSAGGDRRSSGPFIWSDGRTASHAQPKCTDRGKKVRSENEHSASTCKWRSSCKSSEINEVV